MFLKFSLRVLCLALQGEISTWVFAYSKQSKSLFRVYQCPVCEKIEVNEEYLGH